MSDTQRTSLRQAQRVIVKLGTSSCLTSDGRVRGEVLLPLAREIAALRAEGKQIVIVSSGAVGMGKRTSWGKNIDSRDLSAKQALAALGQVQLMNMWQSLFELLGIGVAQVLLTRQELSRRERYLNARNTLCTLLSANILPVVNENDSVATDEIRFGDNDILSALVGSLVEADLVVNLTRAPGLLDFSHKHQEPVVVSEVEKVDEELFDLVAPDISEGGTGGMASKLHAAKEAARYGAAMVIANSETPNILTQILAGENVGTLFWPAKDPLRGRKRWLASSTMVSGSLTLDPGAIKALSERGSSLLNVGIQGLSGEFMMGDIVSVLDSDGKELGRGLSELSSSQVRDFLESRNSESQVAIHRDNLFLREQKNNSKSRTWEEILQAVHSRYPEVTQLKLYAFTEMLKSESKPQILDLRSEAEHAVSHLPGAVRVNGDCEIESLKLDPDRDIVCACAVGFRSSAFATRLLEAGFKKVHNLEGSLFAWANEGHPLEGGTKVHPYDEEWGKYLKDVYRAEL